MHILMQDCCKNMPVVTFLQNDIMLLLNILRHFQSEMSSGLETYSVLSKTDGYESGNVLLHWSL